MIRNKPVAPEKAENKMASKPQNKQFNFAGQKKK
jgi:hypothetical protein